MLLAIIKYMARPTAKIQNEYTRLGYSCIAGVDEVGLGAWAGPVVAGAVILPVKIQLPYLNDSKLVSVSRREELYFLIKEKAIAWGIGVQEAYLVDEIGLAETHRRAMRQAVKNLGSKVDLLLVDGRGIKQLGVETICIVKGDQKVRSIAAASIIAKVTRDNIMEEMHKEWPEYGFNEHKGYGTLKHRRAIAEYGVHKSHRLSYLPVFNQWQGNLFQYAD